MPSIFQYLDGISFREKGLTAVYGRVLEQKTMSLFESDTQGTHGYSGTGLYFKSTLIAIHVGSGSFIHSN